MLNEICEDCLNRVGYENLKLKKLKYLFSDCLNSEQNIKRRCFYLNKEINYGT